MNPPLFESEKKSHRRFLVIYLISTLLLIGVGSAIFYTYSLHRIIDHQNETLKLKTALIRPKLRKLHNSTEKRLLYPGIEGIRTALYDIDRHYLIGEFKPEKIVWDREFWRVGDTLYYRYEMQPYYLGAATVVSSMPLDKAPIHSFQLKIALILFLAVLFVAFIARWLGRLFLAPVHHTIRLLDRFIQDTTHELNTPVSTVLTNIELFKSLHPELENNDELRRIEIASKRLSRLYDDLAYLRLNNRRRRRIEPVDLRELLEERLAYFGPMAQRRQIDLQREITAAPIREMDREDAAKLIENLLSNAIKYTHPGGRIRVELDARSFTVEDNGAGMDREASTRATERFFRANASEGGFGLGLNIVREIVEYYGMKLQIESEEGKGTKVRIVWEE
ncbi:HAMP domain-containing sensor histidine kinase [Nitratifractor sp.]|uniref:sensor histidine kinase n=1 Tax=Nitratifractor sp. TaxID=2268144 RepID=UPI0025F5629A|nr:HAMP domain-containing sensor histidine kinase [Nitratifractor sp.]